MLPTCYLKSILFLILFVPLFASAAIVNWIGDVSSDWNDPNNWAGNTLFANGDDLIIDPANYTNAPIIGTNSTNSPRDITVQNSGILTISANLSITGDLIINSGGSVTQTAGVFDIGTTGNPKDVTVDNGSLTISGGTTNLHGLLIGTNSSTIAFTGGTILMDDEINLFSSSSMTVSTTLTSVTQKDIEITDDASLTVETGALMTGWDDLEFFGDGGSYTQTGGTVSFNDQFEFFGTNATVNISGGLLSVALDINFNTGTGNVINVFGTGTLSAFEVLGTSPTINVIEAGRTIINGVIVPVELIYFKASRDLLGILLEWATASEINNDHFEIERSFDGIRFNKIIDISGSGNSSDRIDYNYIDKTQNGDVYYRLSQVDFDGATEMFNTVFISNEISDDQILMYPIPSKGDYLTIRSLSSGKNLGLVIIYDAGANVISRHQLASNEARILITPKLQKGVYFAKIQIGIQIVTKKFIVDK